MLLTIIFTLLFLAVSVLVVGLPLRRQEALPLTRAEPAVAAPLTYETLLLALSDLEFDHHLGVVTDDDYARVHEQLLAQAAGALERKEQAADGNLAAHIENAVRARRQQPAQPRSGSARFCSQCGRPLDAGDRFCAGCGASLG